MFMTNQRKKQYSRKKKSTLRHFPDEQTAQITDQR